MKMKTFRIMSVMIMFMIPVYAIGQGGYEDETKAKVKELDDFHETIYQIWHEAWPEKNVQLLKELIPAIDAGYENLARAELPGILRDKQEKWDAGVGKLAEIITVYKTASVAMDDTELLKAAENLHSQYEALVRIVRPVSKEVDAFHQELYMLYHYYLPDQDPEKIKISAAQLKLKMNELKDAPLSKRLKSREKEFNKSRESLEKSVDNLNTVIGKESDMTAWEEAIEAVHTDYQKLESVFD